MQSKGNILRVNSELVTMPGLSATSKITKIVQTSKSDE